MIHILLIKISIVGDGLINEYEITDDGFKEIKYGTTNKFIKSLKE